MMEILGLLDTLEATILSGKKIPLSNKVVVNEARLLEIVDKIRILIKSGSGAAKRAIENVSVNDPNNEKMIINQARRESRLIKEGANKYADETLANLLATTLKLQRTLENGRGRLEKMRQNEE